MDARTRRRTFLAAAAAGGGAVLAACTRGSSPAPPNDTKAPSTTTAGPVTPTPPSTSPPAPAVTVADLRIGTAMAAVDHLATTIGPRHGTSAAYAEAVDWVEEQLSGYGWAVSRQRFPTPGGVSWGVPVEAGRSTNVIATLPVDGDRLEPGQPWLAVGAHLDTVPQAPGGEDNASGIGVVLALAEAMAQTRTRLPVVLIAFGSEEPRGPSDDDHHYGSRAYVASLSQAERRSLRGMVSLDRVGVGGVLPVGSAGEPDKLSRALQRAAGRVGVPTEADPFQRSSDHWSFVRDGLPGVRLGSTPYAGYHSAADTADVVDLEQVQRTARTVVSWLS